MSIICSRYSTSGCCNYCTRGIFDEELNEKHTPYSLLLFSRMFLARASWTGDA